MPNTNLTKGNNAYQLTQEEKDNALIMACERGELKHLKELLKCGANPKACGHQSLIWACFSKNLAIAQELAKHYRLQELQELLKNRLHTQPQEVEEIIRTKKQKELETQIHKKFEESKTLNL